MSCKGIMGFFLKFVVYCAVLLVLGIVTIIFGTVVFNGVAGLTPRFFTTVWPAVLNTFQLIGLAMLISVPLALGATLYLTEYARNKTVVRIVRFCADALSGVPSIIFGLVGMSFFVRDFGFGFSLYAGALTISILILPTLLRAFEEALRSVPEGYKMAALSLGATKFRALFTVVIPAARVPILSGTMLALGRVVGETAALVLTMGTARGLINSPWDSGRTLSIHMFLVAKEAVTLTEAYASALLLLFFVWLINIIAYKLTGEKNA